MSNFVPKHIMQRSEVFAMYDLEAQKIGESVPEGVIVVDSSVSQDKKLRTSS